MNGNDRPDDDLLPFLFDELEEARQAAVRKALADDAELAAVARRLATAIEAVRAENVGQVSEDFNDRLRQRMSAALEAGQAETASPPRDAPTLSTWRWIMRSPVSRAAAAALVVLAVTCVAVWFHGAGAPPAFADFLQPILEARTVKCRVTAEMTSLPPGMAVMSGMSAEMQKDLLKAKTSLVMMLGADRSRDEGEDGVMIWDGRVRKQLQLEPAQKRATLFDYSEPPKSETAKKIGQETPTPRHASGAPGPVALFRSLLLESRDKPGTKREPLGEKRLDGRRVVGFRFTSSGTVIHVWGDPQTGLPVRVETTSSLLPNIKVTMSDFAFNLDMDESLFSLEPPAGYEVVVKHISARDESPRKEADLIEMFRYYGQWSGGRFPDLLDNQWLGQVVRNAEWLDANLQQDKPQARRDQQLAEAHAKLERGMMFAVTLPKEADWHYAGRGVCLGEANRPVFWYRPQEGRKYRVVYADLSVREADAPPQVPDVSVVQMEKDLIETLREYSELNSDAFPKSLDVAALALLPSASMHRHFASGQTPQKRAAQASQRAAEALVRLQRGLLFVSLLPEEADWRYAGRGISRGEADRPVFWYRPKGSRKYRVIYADLSVREADAPPNVPAQQPEQDLIDALRGYSRSNGGAFPDSLDSQSMTNALTRTLTKQVFLAMCAPQNGKLDEERRRKIEELLPKVANPGRRDPKTPKPDRKKAADLEEQLYALVNWERLAPGKKNLSEKQKGECLSAYSQQFMQDQMPKVMQVTMQVATGLAFVDRLPPQAAARYAGQGVALGAADKPIFWYRPSDAKKYRVIYGDLSVRDADAPPDVLAAQRVPAPSKPAR